MSEWRLILNPLPWGRAGLVGSICCYFQDIHPLVLGKKLLLLWGRVGSCGRGLALHSSLKGPASSTAEKMVLLCCFNAFSVFTDVPGMC